MEVAGAGKEGTVEGDIPEDTEDIVGIAEEDILDNEVGVVEEGILDMHDTAAGMDIAGRDVDQDSLDSLVEDSEDTEV